RVRRARQNAAIPQPPCPSPLQTRPKASDTRKLMRSTTLWTSTTARCPAVSYGDPVNRRQEPVMLRKLAFAALLAGVVFISGCSDQTTTYMEVTGGGFIFNYRIAEAFAGLVVIPHGT